MSSFRKTITVNRISGGAYVDGHYVEGSTAALTIQASVQPPTINDIQMLPEGRRESKAYRLYTSTQLNTLDENNQNPDIAIIDGEEFEVTAEGQWQNNVINHYKYIVTKINASDG